MTRERYNKICDRWLSLYMIFMWFILINHFTETKLEFILYSISLTFLALVFTLFSLFVVSLLFQLSDWLSGY